MCFRSISASGSVDMVAMLGVLELISALRSLSLAIQAEARQRLN
jgi:hypothetical protein